MASIYVDTDGMFSNADNITKRIEKMQEIFDNTNKEMNVSKDKQIWLGSSSDTMYSKYDELSKNYEPVIESMNKIVKVINNIANSYIEWDKSMIELSETYDLDINKK